MASRTQIGDFFVSSRAIVSNKVRILTVLEAISLQEKRLIKQNDPGARI